MLGGGLDLTTCDPEVREAVFEALANEGAAGRHERRLARLKGML